MVTCSGIALDGICREKVMKVDKVIKVVKVVKIGNNVT